MKINNDKLKELCNSFADTDTSDIPIDGLNYAEEYKLDELEQPNSPEEDPKEDSTQHRLFHKPKYVFAWSLGLVACLALIVFLGIRAGGSGKKGSSSASSIHSAGQDAMETEAPTHVSIIECPNVNENSEIPLFFDDSDSDYYNEHFACLRFPSSSESSPFYDINLSDYVSEARIIKEPSDENGANMETTILRSYEHPKSLQTLINALYCMETEAKDGIIETTTEPIYSITLLRNGTVMYTMDIYESGYVSVNEKWFRMINTDTFDIRNILDIAPTAIEEINVYNSAFDPDTEQDTLPFELDILNDSQTQFEKLMIIGDKFIVVTSNDETITISKYSEDENHNPTLEATTDIERENIYFFNDLFFVGGTYVMALQNVTSCLLISLDTDLNIMNRQDIDIDFHTTYIKEVTVFKNRIFFATTTHSLKDQNISAELYSMNWPLSKSRDNDLLVEHRNDSVSYFLVEFEDELIWNTCSSFYTRVNYFASSSFHERRGNLCENRTTDGINFDYNNTFTVCSYVMK